MTADISDLQTFLDTSPSSFHVAATVAARLGAAGFAECGATTEDAALPNDGFVVRDGALIAWRNGVTVAPTAAFLLVGAHTDSPGFRLKPNPDVVRYGWKQLNVEVYGGILNNSWLDRDLAVAGRVTALDGTHTLVNVARPIARIPQLAVHLDRTVNDALTLDRQTHLQPVWGVGSTGRGAFAEWLIDEMQLPDAPAWWDLCLYDAQPSAVIGADASLLASGRLDNQLSCWAGVGALIATPASDHTSVIVLNDHEEVGSASTTGASGPLLEHLLERLVSARGGDRDAFLQALSVSACVSADNAHAIHPNYPERHDGEHAPMVNAGPAIKINANQRYATSSATAARFVRACNDSGVAYQTFVSRNNMPCGSTIGPLTATRLGIDTVDVGIPQLSMHSARELCGTEDPVAMASALTSFLAGA
ncbi:MAG TPA: M18 family aminopeptidase [Ilumatobacter sp.]|nr:M18 family aminopeptidase [Ilumatobacter sp.]